VTNDNPLVSIGMPVYNGETYIRQTLDSLLAQDYRHFELVISDNASTDRTREICLDYAARDNRITFYRNETNLGAVHNFKRVLALSSGKYFMWASDHDLWDPSFISRCVSVLEEDLEVVLVYSRTMQIDFDETPLGLYADQIDTRGMPALQRYLCIIWNLGCCNMIYGLIRREVVRHTVKVRNILGPDNAILAELALRGAFAQIPDALFYRRKNRPDEDPETRKRRLLYDLDPTNLGQKTEKSYNDLYRELLYAHLGFVMHAPLSFPEKLYAGIGTMLCFRMRFKVRHWGALFTEGTARMMKYFLPKSLRRRVIPW
jgi:glycosyltransferase involved in cell wall biosynthesis